MRRTTFLPTLLGLVWLSASAPAADTYNIDPFHSSIGFAVTHMMISTVHGKFDDFIGTVVLDNNVLQEGSASIQTRSIDTGVTQRDNHLRSPDFFDAAKYPLITFQSKRVEKKGDGLLLVGDFTMHGVTKELALPVTLKGPVSDPKGNRRIGLQARTKLNRRDYGLTYNKMLETGGLVVGDEIEIEINAEAVKPVMR